jgi:phosphoserine phosphatase RsbU/P
MNNNENKSVLIIDDDLTIRKLMSHHLKADKYKIFEAPGAPEGFQILEKEKVDLVLCDVTMEEMDGFTFCQKVRESEKYRALPFIFVTAKTSQEDKTRALEAGGDDLITKPLDFNALLVKVKALLRRSEIYKIYGAKTSLKKSLQKTAVSRIVLIDDDLPTAELFKFNLNKSGFECTIASNAEEGLKLIKADPPDLIISDIIMPLVDGFEFRKIVLADDNLKQIPFVFLTTQSNEDDILQGYELGIADFIIKSSGLRVIVAKINAILTTYKKQRRNIIAELHNAADNMRVMVVPETTPAFKSFLIKQWHVPYEGIPGGDFIEYFTLDEHNIAVILGDVMGKKWGAWYFAFAYAGYIRSALRSILPTLKEYKSDEILQHVNNMVYNDAKISEVFITLSIIILNNDTKKIKYSGAGDLPVYFIPSGSERARKIKSKGKLLGFAAEGNYDEITIDIEPNDRIVLLTDGILESRNAEGEQFGYKNLDSIIDNTTPTDDLVQQIQTNFRAFTGNHFEDDVSLISIKYCP